MSILFSKEIINFFRVIKEGYTGDTDSHAIPPAYMEKNSQKTGFQLK